MSLPGAHVRVVNVDGHPYLATVLPYIEPSPMERTWRYQFGYVSKYFEPVEANVHGYYEYVRTKEEQEN